MGVDATLRYGVAIASAMQTHTDWALQQREASGDSSPATSSLEGAADVQHVWGPGGARLATTISMPLRCLRLPAVHMLYHLGTDGVPRPSYEQLEQLGH